jgi:AraC-like DNA-binding protein
MTGINSFAIESPLGRWTITGWSPPHLAGAVESIWHFDGTITCLRERTFPNGLLQLIVHLGGRYRVVEKGEAELCPELCIGGMQTGPLVIESPGTHCCVMGVQLHPVGAYRLFGTPLGELAGQSNLDLQDVVGPAARELQERCLEAGSAEEQVRCAADWIAERLARSPHSDPAISWTAAEIKRRQGAVSISELRDRTGLSKTRLATAFRDQVGVTPKLFARIHRFRRALELIHQGSDPLVEVALSAGYYDQPHLNAEFRELSGLAPGEYLSASRYPNSVSLAEAG